MRRVIISIFCVLIPFIGKSQEAKLKQNLLNNWIKTDISARDGSPFYDQESLNLSLDLDIFSTDSLRLFNGNRVSTLRYRLLPDSVLSVAGIHLKIVELSSIKMVVESFENEGYDFKMTYTPKKYFDLTYTPDAYRAKNGEIVFPAIKGKLEPQFVSKNMSPTDYIFERFGFPEYRKGGFVVRFVVSSKGEVTGVRVVASSNNKYNNKLVEAVYKTKGMWRPAVFKGEKVNSEVEYDFNLGYNNRELTSEVDSNSYSKQYYDYGLSFVESGAYKNAATYFKKAIEFNPLNIDAYFKHAEVSFAMRRNDEGCESLSYLILLEQKKAEPLYEKYCKK